MKALPAEMSAFILWSEASIQVPDWEERLFLAVVALELRAGTEGENAYMALLSQNLLAERACILDPPSGSSPSEAALIASIIQDESRRALAH